MAGFREHNRRQGSPGFGAGRRFGGNRFENNDRPSGGRGGFGGGRGGGRGFDRPEMHDATCSKCGKPCQVPFRPTGSKPVFCSDCFRQQENGSGSNDFARSAPRSSAVSSGMSPEQFKQLNEKLDKILAFLANLEIEVADDEDLDEEDSEEAEE